MILCFFLLKRDLLSQLPQNGPKFGDFVGIWYLNTQTNWGQDVNSLSGCKKNSGPKWTRMENEWEIGKKVKILSFFVRTIYKSATILKKKHTTVKG